MTRTFLLSFLCFVTLGWAQQFQGMIKYEITDYQADERTVITVFTDGTNFRLDFQNPEDGSHSSFIQTKDKTMVIDHKQKSALQLATNSSPFSSLFGLMPLPAMVFPPLSASSLETLKHGGKVVIRNNDGTRISIDQAGNKTVAGYPCQRWIIEDTKQQERVEFCLAKGLGTFFLNKEFTDKLRSQLKNSPFADSFFPLEITFWQKGNLVTRIAVTEIDQQPPAASTFQIPKGYKIQKFSISDQ